MGLEPLLSGNRSEDEGLFVRQHEYWAQTLIAAIDRDGDGGDGRAMPRPALGVAA
jgi:benzoate/toluate 1,2-dioxygenase alpha subunit